MPLTDTAIRNARPSAKKPMPSSSMSAASIWRVSPAGGKWWRLKYRFEGKEKRLSLGVYPE